MAEMDRVSVKDLGLRVEKYLEDGGEYRKEQLPHNTAAIDLYFALWTDNIQAFAGFRALRHFRDANGWGRVSPDLVVCLDREDGTSLMVYLELELTARWRSGIRRKLRPYVRLQKLLGHSVPLLFVAKDETAEREVQRAGKAVGVGVAVDHDQATSDGGLVVGIHQCLAHGVRRGRRDRLAGQAKRTGCATWTDK